MLVLHNVWLMLINSPSVNSSNALAACIIPIAKWTIALDTGGQRRSMSTASFKQSNILASNFFKISSFSINLTFPFNMATVAGIEPTFTGSKPVVLPLNYAVMCNAVPEFCILELHQSIRALQPNRILDIHARYNHIIHPSVYVFNKKFILYLSPY